MLAQSSAIFANLKSGPLCGREPERRDALYYRELANAFQRLLPEQLADELIEIVIVLENRVGRTHSACDLNVDGIILA